MRRRFMSSKTFDENDYLTFICLEDGSTISFSRMIEYSINGHLWQRLGENETLVVYKGQHISVKQTFIVVDIIYGAGIFKTSGKFNLCGNILSMRFGDNAKIEHDLSPSYAFAQLFRNNTSIVDCSLLKLPDTTLASNCYYGMFFGCTSLTSAPELPATTLAYSCYQSMFNDCTSLTSAPELPATTLANNCYEFMFNSCRNLNYIKMLATDISASNCLTDWVSGVASSGTFVKHPNMTSLPTGVSGIPTGWTVVDN